MKKTPSPVLVIDEENNLEILARFSSILEAEQYIEELSKSNPDKVYRGGFGIDAPEYML